MRNFLPKNHRFAHQYCFFLHDLLADIIVFGEAASIFKVKFKFREKSHSESIKGKSGEELFKWMEENGYGDMAVTLVHKSVFIALLSDFCHFVSEALQNSRKAKLTVTYALLRKPFKENLLYFEWMLADPADFLRTFYDGNIRQLSSSSFPKEKKVALIRKAMLKTPMKHWVDPHYIYQLRYDKGAESSLEHLWQKANHLITTFDFLGTEEMNFNFVFSGERERQSQWSYLYFTLPILLFHAKQVIESLLRTFAKPLVPRGDIAEMRIVLGFLLCMHDEEMQKRLANIQQDIKGIFQAIRLHCPKCQHRVSYRNTLLKQVYLYSAIKCAKCGYRMVFGNHVQTAPNRRNYDAHAFDN